MDKKIKGINPIKELVELNQFIETELIHQKETGLLNIISGCFVKPVINYKSKSLLSKAEKSYTGEIDLIWSTGGGIECDSHISRISGTVLTKFITTMKKQSTQLD